MFTLHITNQNMISIGMTSRS